MLGALPVVAAGYAARSMPRWQKVLYAIGGGVGGAAYVAWSVWLFALGRQLRRPAPDSPA